MFSPKHTSNSGFHRLIYKKGMSHKYNKITTTVSVKSTKKEPSTQCSINFKAMCFKGFSYFYLIHISISNNISTLLLCPCLMGTGMSVKPGPASVGASIFTSQHTQVLRHKGTRSIDLADVLCGVRECERPTALCPCPSVDGVPSG